MISIIHAFMFCFGMSCLKKLVEHVHLLLCKSFNNSACNLYFKQKSILHKNIMIVHIPQSTDLSTFLRKFINFFFSEVFFTE